MDAVLLIVSGRTFTVNSGGKLNYGLPEVCQSSAGTPRLPRLKNALLRTTEEMLLSKWHIATNGFIKELDGGGRLGVIDHLQAQLVSNG